MSVNPLDVFSGEQVDRARRYHRPLYVALAVDLVFGIGALAVLAFTDVKDGVVDGRRPLVAFGLVTLVWIAVRLPVGFWRGYVYERRWGFSTQTLAGWIGDAVKGTVLSVVFMAMTLYFVVGFADTYPRWWPVAGAAAGAASVFVVRLIAPPLLEPVFNRFRRLDDPELDAELRALAARAGSPVRKILVADASRRTTKLNAYVSGFGPTRRLVLYDTLVAKGDPREVKLVLAHELGHRRAHHVLKGVVVESLGWAALLAALWAAYRWTGVLSAIGAESPGDSRTAPFVLLAIVVGEVAALPVATAVSRRWERYADRFSLDVTEDADAFERAHRDLAASNLAELDPPRPLYLFFFTHPTPPERLALAREWAEARAA